MGSSFASAQAAAQRPSPKTLPVDDVPDPKNFQSGDFIWPKKKGAYVPRRKTGQLKGEEQKSWEDARERLLREDPSRTGLSRGDAAKLKRMSYEEFEKLYFAGPAQSRRINAKQRSLNIGVQTLYVGHIGIIEIDAQGVPHVTEAIPTAGLQGAVTRTRYADWIVRESGMQVWHGRVRDLGIGVGDRIAAEAAKQIGKPYAFFNFNLNDDSGFYCSKLAWMSVWRAASFAIDDDPNPSRPFLSWFSPKQLLNAKSVTLLHKPGEY